MDSRNSLATGRSILIFLMQLIVFIACIWYIQFIYYVEILPDKQVNDSYVQTQCIVSGETLTVNKGLVTGYRADFNLSYTVNGVQYSSQASGNGLNRSFTTDRSSEEDIIKQFNIGASYPCWYNPNNPQMVVLILRHSWTSTFPLLIPTIIGLIVLFYLAISIFQFFEFLAVRMTKK